LSRAQWFAIAIVVIAVSLLALGLGSLPWVALFLATTFAVYGVIKRRLQLGPVMSVTIEVMLVSPVAVFLLWRTYLSGAPVFGGDFRTFALLVMAGPMTAVPLILFSYGAKRMKMASVGLILYLNPTMQFISAVFLFAEPFTSWHLGAFALIWVALAIYSASAFRQERARRSASRHVSASGTIS
jgi:chloramphenicol-sensitive protein RarD